MVSLRYLQRGALAGLAGGALAGAFGYLLAEPVMDRAVDLEAARQRAAGEHVVELYTRHTQHVGFVVATTLVGVALGVLLGVTHGVLHRADPDRDPWRRALALGGAAFFGLFLVPFLRYPANPPGVGDPGTIDARTSAYLSALVIGLVGAVTLGLAARGLAERGWPASHRQLALVGIAVATVALTFVLPDDTDPIDVGAGLLWEFRLLSLATSALLWGGLTAVFGLLGERAARRTAPGARAAAVA
ncbi:MAG: CbtA family protein [Mycobacteriales bacterium]